MGLTILDLGPDIIETCVFSLLSTSDLLSLAQTCTQFQELAKSHAHWNLRYAKEFYLDSAKVAGLVGLERYKARYLAKLYILSMGEKNAVCDGPIVDFGFLAHGLGFVVRRPESTSFHTLDNHEQTLDTADTECLRVRQFTLQGLDSGQIRQWDCYDSEGWTYGDDAEWVDKVQTRGILTGRHVSPALVEQVSWQGKRLSDPDISPIDCINPAVDLELPPSVDIEREIIAAHPEGVDHLLVRNGSVVVAVGKTLNVFKEGAEPLVFPLDAPVRKMDVRWGAAVILDSTGLLYSIDICSSGGSYAIILGETITYEPMPDQTGKRTPLKKEVVDFANEQSMVILTEDGYVWSENGGGSGMWTGIHCPTGDKAGPVMIGPPGNSRAGNVAAVCID